MKANPGGQIHASEVLGRDSLIAQLWEILESRSILMTAERRIGKTSVIRKMREEPLPNWVPIFQDLEKVHTPEEFALAVYEEVREYFGRRQRTMNASKRFLEAIGGFEIGGFLKIPENKEKHWKRLLSHTVEDLANQQAPNRLVFFWDEMPYMIDSIRRTGGEEAAIEVLDLLRSLRQTYPSFRMVLTGSIGLHHVLMRLKEADYKNQPVNDMEHVDVGALAPHDAQDLAAKLIRGEGLATSDSGRTARAIAEEADNVPFYIHSVISCLKRSGRPAEPDQVAAVVNEQMISPVDPWQLAHYRERVKQYYPQDDALVMILLDHLATCAHAASIDELFAVAKAGLPVDRNRLIDLLKLLQRDHYVSRTGAGHFQFLFPLIRRWWALDRGLL